MKTLDELHELRIYVEAQHRVAIFRGDGRAKARTFRELARLRRRIRLLEMRRRSA